MTSYELDTNTLLRYTTNDVPSEADVVELMIKRAQDGGIALHICEPIFIETAVMLKNYFKFPKKKIVSLLSFLLNSPELHIEHHDLLTQSLELYIDYGIDFVDCVLLVRAQTHRHKLFTFDSRLSLLASSQSKIS